MPRADLDLGLLDIRVAFPDSQSIAIRVRKVNLPSPWLLHHLYAELGCDPVHIVNPEVDECAWSGIALVLGQVQPNLAAA